MPWTLELDDATGTIGVVLSGAVSGADLREATEAALALSRERDTERFLIDARAMVLRASTMDLFSLPGKLYEGRMDRRRARLALVAPATPEGREAARFYETACLNRDWQVRVFHELADAVSWLDDAAGDSR